ncbi:MAG: amidohydrolase [Tissierellia bacterium]|nr:amidohydrolase [Tissierellia bacterium]
MKFINTQYIDVIQGEVISHVDLTVEGERITAIEPTQDSNAQTEYSDLLLVPGFINAHSHLGMSYFRNLADDMNLQVWLNEAIWPLEAHLTPEDIYWSSLLSMAEAIKSGTTLVNDMYYEMDRVAQGADEIGMRLLATRGLTDITGDGEAKLKEVRELYENYHNAADGRVKVVPAPHAIYTNSKDYLKQVLEMTKEMDGIVHTHASETQVEVNDCLKEHGVTPVNYYMDLGYDEVHTIAAHCVYMTEEEMDRVDPEKFFPVYNPTSNLKLASGFTPIVKMLEKGLTIALGTDGDSSNNNQNILEEMHLAGIVNKALTLDPEAVPAAEVLRMATINGAKAMGQEEELGSIEVGKKADLAFFDLTSLNFTPRNNLISALVYSASSEDVRHVLCDGKFILKDRKLTRINLEEVQEEVRQRLTALLERKKAHDQRKRK